MKISRTVRVALYGEVNMNLIDGSSVWVQSVAQMLTTLSWVRVTLLLRTAEQRDVLTAPLREHPRIELVEPQSLGHRGPLGPAEATECLQSLDAEQGFDLVLLRGRGVSEQVCRADSFAGRLSVYYLPPHDYEPGGEVEHLRLIAPSCERIQCQTETIRAMAAAAVGEYQDKLILLPPMIPPPSAPPPERAGVGPLKLLYAGNSPPSTTSSRWWRPFAACGEAIPGRSCTWSETRSTTHPTIPPSSRLPRPRSTRPRTSSGTGGFRGSGPSS